jgi:4-hydroxy-3-methylbut-2-enyl diphosphate reductase
MNVIRAKVLGYCMGVRRAVDMAYKAAAEAGVYTMGPLIHNPQVLEDLQHKGVEILDEGSMPPGLSGSVVIIRAHGITPALEAELVHRGARIVDATCPKVKANQMKARSLAEEGYMIFLAGEEKHGEIAGIRGYVGPVSAGRCVVVGSREEAAAEAEQLLSTDPLAKTALLGQTTIPEALYRSIGEEMRKFFPNLKIVDTICAATRDRQEALRELLGQVDAVIVAGGRSSANTRYLLGIARDPAGGSPAKPAWLVESAADLPPEISAYAAVGLSAGASTPDAVIDGIEAALMGMGGVVDYVPNMGVY